jgi:hypothetical protein
MTDYNTIAQSNTFIVLDQYSKQKLAIACHVKSPCVKGNTDIAAIC